MSAKIDIFSDDWCELIFEEKNQKYGAYSLRKDSSKRHIYGLVITAFLFIVGFSMPSLIERFVPKRIERDVAVRTLSDLNLEKPKEQENILKELPPPPPPLRNTIKFTPPVIKPDEQVAEEEEPKLQQEVVDAKSAIGAITYDQGTDDVAAPMPTDDKLVTQEEEEPFSVVEQMPEYPGGAKAMYEWIYKNVKYPQIAAENGITGTIYVNFVVDLDGKVTRVKILRGIDPSCDAEAMRVVKGLPAWKPGKQGGKPARVYYTIPIKFVLQ